ncbi:MAG: GNAT family N-acetyltransferase [Actinomycetota bacterium]|jgi:acetate---CoA ligase (ADP-forming)
MEAAPGYPVEFEADVVLSDGGTVLIRPIRPDDAPALARFHQRLSPESVYLRYFSPHPHLSEAELSFLTTVDYRWRMALVAILGDDMVAVARYEGKEGATDAEVAFLVEDAHQGRGIGTVLLEWLAAAARRAGITEFYATTLSENQKMLAVFREAGFQTKMTVGGGEVMFRFPVADSCDLAVAIAKREHRAEARSVGRLLAPHSIAVIGAGQSPAGMGHQLFKNLLAGDFQGPVYPVNPKSAHVGGVRAYPSVLDVPDDVELAIICVPAATVPEVLAQCAAKRVGGVVMITAGFAEVGGDGAAAERELVRLARRNGMRVIGPNCMGVINTAPAVAMNGTFAPVTPLPGRIALGSQSGAIGIAALQRSARLGLGISSFVSVGNKADVSGNDLLQYWENDPETDVVLLYLESFGNPGKFHRIAQRVARGKPIVAVKSGRSQAGSRGASSHTAALASPDRAVDALFRQTGVIRVDTLEQLFDTAAVLAHQPLPAGRRVAIVGNSGGPGVLAADACEAAGLEVPELPAATQEALRACLPPAAGVRNPVDMMASAGPAAYQEALRTLLADDAIDAVIVVCTPTGAAPIDDVAIALADVMAEPWSKPVVANLVGVESIPAPLRGERAVPCFPFPEAAAQALARAAWYADWRRRPAGRVPTLDDIDLRGPRRMVADFLAAQPGGGWLDPVIAADVLAAFGVPVTPLVHVTSSGEAAQAAAAISGPVALKAAGVLHKTDVGGVRLGLASPEAVAAAYEEMASRLDAAGEEMTGAHVQAMVPPGVVETIAGVVRDPSFGPLVMFGLGGVAAELIGDTALKVAPLTDHDAAELVRGLRSSPLLFGYRGSAPADTAGLEDLLLRLSILVQQLPELAELDVNPVIAGPGSVVAVDWRMRLAPAGRDPGRDLRRLR